MLHTVTLLDYCQYLYVLFQFQCASITHLHKPELVSIHLEGLDPHPVVLLDKGCVVSMLPQGWTFPDFSMMWLGNGKGRASQGHVHRFVANFAPPLHILGRLLPWAAATMTQTSGHFVTQCPSYFPWLPYAARTTRGFNIRSSSRGSVSRVYKARGQCYLATSTPRHPLHY